jgi:hypothetical protein
MRIELQILRLIDWDDQQLLLTLDDRFGLYNHLMVFVSQIL